MFVLFAYQSIRKRKKNYLSRCYAKIVHRENDAERKDHHEQFMSRVHSFTIPPLLSFPIPLV